MNTLGFGSPSQLLVLICMHLPRVLIGFVETAEQMKGRISLRQLQLPDCMLAGAGNGSSLTSALRCLLPAPGSQEQQMQQLTLPGLLADSGPLKIMDYKATGQCSSGSLRHHKPPCNGGIRPKELVPGEAFPVVAQSLHATF